MQELKDKKGYEMLFSDYSQCSHDFIAVADACNKSMKTGPINSQLWIREVIMGPTPPY